MNGHLVIFVKAPQMGRVKTRLGRELGAYRAAQIYRRMMRLMIARLRAGPWQVSLAVDPLPSVHDDSLWPRGINRFAQVRGGLGERMQAVFRQLGPGPVVIIGSDCPSVGAGDIHAAFQKLARRRPVLGPAADGGYWLIGLQGVQHRRLFAGVRWSTDAARSDTQATLRGTPSLLATHRDVDTVADLKAYVAAAQAPFKCSVKRGISSTRLQGLKRLSS